MIEEIGAYKEGTAAQWDSTLEKNFCEDYDGTVSCCTDGLIGKVPRLIKGFMMR